MFRRRVIEEIDRGGPVVSHEMFTVQNSGMARIEGFGEGVSTRALTNQPFGCAWLPRRDERCPVRFRFGTLGRPALQTTELRRHSFGHKAGISRRRTCSTLVKCCPSTSSLRCRTATALGTHLRPLAGTSRRRPTSERPRLDPNVQMNSTSSCRPRVRLLPTGRATPSRCCCRARSLSHSTTLQAPCRRRRSRRARNSRRVKRMHLCLLLNRSALLQARRSLRKAVAVSRALVVLAPSRFSNKKRAKAQLLQVHHPPLVRRSRMLASSNCIFNINYI